MYNFELGKRLFIDSKLHIWNRPINLDFNTSKGDIGGAFELDFRYFFLSKSPSQYRGTSVDIGTTMKTFGFLPEELFLKERILFLQLMVLQLHLVLLMMTGMAVNNLQPQ